MTKSTQRTEAQKNILTINGGSSSIKFTLFGPGLAPQRLLSGSIERIGLEGSFLQVKTGTATEGLKQSLKIPTHREAVAVLIDWIKKNLTLDTVMAVGHRVVHGGPNYDQPQLVTPEVLRELRSLSPIDPEHLPEEILLIESFQKCFPGLPQVACFDTSFHHGLPLMATMLPIPRRYAAQGVRRYGFHGLSFAYLMSELQKVDEPAATSGRVILAHLGNGTSLAAVRNGCSVDTTMGFTPAAGVPMSTRSGDLDPGLIGYLARTEKMTPAQFTHMTNHESGLLGVSQISSDMRVLLENEMKHESAAEAIGLFCYEIKKRIGAFATVLGGMDTLIFTGGIGENSPKIRELICSGLEFLGVELNSKRNARSSARISEDSGPVRVRVIRTDEEIMIARAIRLVLRSEAQDSHEPPTRRKPFQPILKS